MRYFIYYLIVANIAGFLSMGIDKGKAKRGAWRISERFLILLALFGGSIGSLFGMYLFHHKTKHKKFVYGIPAILALQLLLAALVFLSDWQEPKPVKTVRSELNLIQQLDEATIRDFISYEDMMHAGSTSLADADSEITKVVQLFFQNFKYRILSYSTTDQSATVNVEITNIDTQALAKDLCLELITQSIAPECTGDSLASTSAYFSLLGSILKENDYKLVSTPAHFDLINTDGNWTIQNNDTLEDELVGGFITYLHDPYLVSPEEITSMIFETFRKMNAEDWVSYLSMSDIFSTYSSLYEKVDLALANQISKCFSYNIKEVTQTENSASATVDITSLDLESVLNTYLERLLDYASTTDAVRATDTELADKTAALLMECLNSNTKTITKTVTIPFVNNGISWQMQLDDSFTDALLGNMNKAVETFQNKASDD